MIRMVDRDGDGQVSFAEFYRMLTNGREPPLGLLQAGGAGAAGSGAGAGAGGRSSTLRGLTLKGFGDPDAPGAAEEGPLDMAAVLQARNVKKTAIESFAKMHGFTMEQIKAALQTFRVSDKLVRGPTARAACGWLREGTAGRVWCRWALGECVVLAQQAAGRSGCAGGLRGGCGTPEKAAASVYCVYFHDCVV